jgi:hypothetical protein
MPAAQNYLLCNEFELKLFLESKAKAQHHRFTLEAGARPEGLPLPSLIVTSLHRLN